MRAVSGFAIGGDLNRSSVEISLCHSQSRALCGVKPAMAAV